MWPRWFSTVAFVHNRKFGNLFILGVALDTVIRLVFPTFWKEQAPAFPRCENRASRRKLMISVAPFRRQHREGVLSVILPIQQEEFGIPVTIGDQPDLLDIPGSTRTHEGTSGSPSP